MLSIPRDLLVTIPGYGQNKINAAYSLGGAKLSVEAVRQVLGIPIDHFIDIDFDGFEDVVNKLGGAYLMIDTRYYNNTATDDGPRSTSSPAISCSTVPRRSPSCASATTRTATSRASSASRCFCGT